MFMAIMLEFYNPQGSPIKTTNYVVNTLNTSKGKRKQAVATHNEKKLYRFVSSDFENDI